MVNITNKYIVVLITAKDSDEAQKISRELLNQKLVACVNVVKDVRSLFWWQGKVDEAQEVLLIAKSQKKCFKDIVKTVKAVHSYEVPEIIALPIIDGNEAYLQWVKEMTNN